MSRGGVPLSPTPARVDEAFSDLLSASSVLARSEYRGQARFVLESVDVLRAEIERARESEEQLRAALETLTLTVSEEDPEAGWSQSLASAHSRARDVLARYDSGNESGRREALDLAPADANHREG